MDTIFEHLSTMLTSFGLVAFQNPSGRDTILEGYIAGRGPDNIFGMPQPFFIDDSSEAKIPDTAVSNG